MADRRLLGLAPEGIGMQHIAGTFRRDRHAAADRASIFLVIDARRERVRWYGSFLLPAKAPLRQPGPYYLELADGRHGAVLVSRVRSMQCGHVGGFVGQGPLMGPADPPANATLG